jgi:4-amino-4-deoxy-L-arabinose transferase-like glycosyltransferase
MSTRKNLWLPLLGIFIVALVVRVAGLTWGLPTPERFYSYHPDERQIAGAVASLEPFSGDFNPDFFNYPSLFIYLAWTAHFLGTSLGILQPQPQLWSALHDVILAARFVSALLGALTAPLVCLTARHIVSTRIALLAGILMALAPGHVQHSHFATVDVPSTFFIALSLYFTARAVRFYLNEHKRESTKQLLWAAFVAGLAGATKYNAIVVLLAPLVALWFFSTNRVLTSLKLVGISILGFIVGCPMVLFAFGDFWGDGQYNGFAYEMFVHSRQGSGEIFQSTGNGSLYHLTFNLPFAFTAPLLLASILGFAIFLIQKHQPRAMRVLTWPVVAFGLLYFFALGFSQVRFMRYVLPLVPVLCVGVALLIFSLKNRGLKTGGAAAFCLLALVATSDVLRPFLTTDPRDQAARWMNQNARSSSVALVENPWFYSPPLSPQDVPPGSNVNANEVLSRQTNFKLSVIGFDADKLQSSQPDYVVMSEFEWRDKERLGDKNFADFQKQLSTQYNLTKKFGDEPRAVLPGREFVPHDFLYTKPQVRIYRRRD